MWRGWINTILAHLSPGVRGRKCACESHLVKATTTSEIFREGKKYARDRDGPCHQRVSNTLQAFFFPPGPCHAPPFLCSPMLQLPTRYSSPFWVSLSCSDGSKRTHPRAPSVEGAPDHSQGRTAPAGRPLASPSHPTACGARLLQLSRDAFHPSYVHLGRR